MSSDSDWEVRHPSTPFYVHTIGIDTELLSGFVCRHFRAPFHVAL
jgi:hypothetical protein